jgi:predicted nucleic acid-binding protein
MTATEASRAFSALLDDDDVAMAAVSVAELWAGVEVADARHRAARERFVQIVMQVVPVIPYDEGVARRHAVLLAHVQRTGRRRGAHDLLIAATAARTGRAVLTNDAAARFADLPDVLVVTDS